ncbi:RagB/SusD family nutrient uptake outer membrane protein [Flavobacterium sp. AG291]|uniref:RagB/SusD family nutrient uptake outer membrane protein n=1 Tax=Flavobacterium sp. AG291 TaxID=2184000 RepID=UPI000E0A9629|nr:RagB/SusD family nutrient uptake outer membrane protein [Flavobacterium sp. AG291]RDI11244.1 RagB/SusD domain-containing protein [Flavobacterium sp. AG291]
MKKYLRYTIVKTVLACGIFTCAIACEPFVDVDPPQSQLPGITVFENADTAKAALANCYATLNSTVLLTGSIQGLSVTLGNYADELIPSGTNAGEQALYQNDLTAVNAGVASFWNNAYNLIYSLNAITEGVEISTGILPAEKQNLIGQAILIRSVVYFYLVNLFGDIPYTATTDYTINAKLSKRTVAEVLQQLENDFTAAYHYLPDEYSVTDRTIPNKSVAAAFLARLYLYMGKWDDARLRAGEIIGNSANYNLESDLDKVFLKESSSTLWQLSPFSEGQPTADAQSFIFTSGPPPARALDPELVHAFEEGDLRRKHWIGEVTDGASTWYHAYKYKQVVPQDVSAEYTIALRLEELYLIRAEARTMLGDIAGAQQDLNMIRQRAGLNDTEAMTTEGLLSAIGYESRFEFFTEQGHRWFDLKRTGLANGVLATVKPGWNETDILWPLPQNELLLNPSLLPQNPGY